MRPIPLLCTQSPGSDFYFWATGTLTLTFHVVLLCAFLSVALAQQQDVDELVQKVGENGEEGQLSASPSTSEAVLSKNQQPHNDDEKGWYVRGF